MTHDREAHFFSCGACGYVGPETELPDDPKHRCGKDECPECKAKWCINCCYPSYEDAENDTNCEA